MEKSALEKVEERLADVALLLQMSMELPPCEEVVQGQKQLVKRGSELLKQLNELQRRKREPIF